MSISPRPWPIPRAPHEPRGAQLQLDYGEWLRRRRRINDAKPILGKALETFRRLGAGVDPAHGSGTARLRRDCASPAAAPGALGGLTAQRREIVILAGHGLTDGAVADRTFVSPRTVASHLYRSYPKLGSRHHQLHDLIDHAGAPQASAWRTPGAGDCSQVVDTAAAGPAVRIRLSVC